MYFTQTILFALGPSLSALTIYSMVVIPRQLDCKDAQAINASISVLPEKYGTLKKEIASKLNPLTMQKTWGEVLDALQTMTSESAKAGPDIVPQIDFDDLRDLPNATLELIKRRGAVVIRNVVPKDEAEEWKQWLEEYVKVNDVTSEPETQNQFFHLYWTKSQVKARSHPNVLAVSAWLNNLYHQSFSFPESDAEKIEGLSLDNPLAYADRFRIRRAGVQWDMFSPHIDGGGIERWEDPEFRKCFTNILTGKWKEHDPYDLGPRLNARNSLYGRPNASSIFRTFQGWLALSSTGPGEGTLRVFPDVLLSNAYLILRPFFRLKEGATDILNKENWVFDASDTEFQGIIFDTRDKRLFGPVLSPERHPHMKLGEAMVSMPHVEPGDMVFWHCDVVHSVEVEHHGNGDSSVMYIPAVPTTIPNKAYIRRQAQSFLKGVPPPDYPQDVLPETGNKGVGVESDIVGEAARRAMGLTEA